LPNDSIPRVSGQSIPLRQLDQSADMEKIAALEAKGRILIGKFWDAPELGYSVATLWDE